MIGVTILGNNSAVPAHSRHPTAQVVQMGDKHFLVDCGEGTQIQMSLYKIRRNKINHIFISHLHGDHYFGLIGLVNSLALNNRQHELHIYSPKGLKEIIEIQLNAAGAQLPYPCYFHILEEEGILLDEKTLTVECFKVNHRIECYGFLFKEKRNPRKIILAKVQEYGIPMEYYEALHRGQDFVTPEGTVIANEVLTVAGAAPKSYAYCADTIFHEPICEKIQSVNLLYHEATYLSNLEEKAASRFHSTTIQAATIAKKSGAGKLLIGHFSSMYDTLDEHQKEARTVFENTDVAQEGTCYFA